VRCPANAVRSALLALAACSVLALSAAAAGSCGPVELVRDRWGTPHVFARTDAGAMYGLGYATAEDRGFQMHYALRIIQGRLAEVVGDVKKTRRDETAVQSDRKMRTFGFYRAAREVVQNLDEETLGLLQAYCDGVNRRFEEAPGDRHPLAGRRGLHAVGPAGRRRPRPLAAAAGSQRTARKPLADRELHGLGPGAAQPRAARPGGDREDRRKQRGAFAVGGRFKGHRETPRPPAAA